MAKSLYPKVNASLWIVGTGIQYVCKLLKVALHHLKARGVQILPYLQDKLIKFYQVFLIISRMQLIKGEV